MEVCTDSSSPLSEHEEAELELVSMETTDSESGGHCGEEGLEQEEEESEAEEEELEGEGLASRGSGLWWPCSMLCS